MLRALFAHTNIIYLYYICKLNIKAYDRAITLIFEGPKKYLNPTLKVI